MFDGGQKAAFEQQTFLAFAELKVEFVSFTGGFVFHGHLARLDLRWQVVEAQHVAEVEIVVVGRICQPAMNGTAACRPGPSKTTFPTACGQTTASAAKSSSLCSIATATRQQLALISTVTQTPPPFRHGQKTPCAGASSKGSSPVSPTPPWLRAKAQRAHSSQPFCSASSISHKQSKPPVERVV